MNKEAAEGIRTLDLVLTKDALYQLSYSSCASRSRLMALTRASTVESEHDHFPGR